MSQTLLRGRASETFFKPKNEKVNLWYAILYEFQKDRSQNGDFNLEGQPCFSVDDDIVGALVENSLKIIPEEIAERMNVDNSATLCRLEKLGYVSKLDTDQPRSLTERNKLEKPFLYKIATDDEKRKDSTYNRRGPEKKVGECASNEDIVGCKGIFRFEQLQPSETIKAINYCKQLTRLDAVIREN
ncbi:hypothetical protein Trydic_g11071 [Trypoxylus dichotomus]